jgi:glycine/D-amino acid oxidase-like deaminating enzyme
MDEASEPSDLHPFNSQVLEQVRDKLAKLLDQIGRVQIVNGISGFDGYTEAKRPLCGVLPGHEDLFIATAFSGRGYKYGLPVANAIVWQINDYLQHPHPVRQEEGKRMSSLLNQACPPV